MTLPPLPDTIEGLDIRRWETFKPYYDELLARPLDEAGVRSWVQDWSDVSRVLGESINASYIRKSLDTADEAAEAEFLDIIQQVIPRARVADQALKERLLAFDLDDEDLRIMLRNLRNQADLFRVENVPVLTRVEELANEYEKITGGMQALWDGEPRNLNQLRPFLQSKDRDERRRAWELIMGMWAGERERLNELYVAMLAERGQLAANAGLPDYRAYAFRELGRFAYTPDDCLEFHDAIEAIVVPAATRVLERKRRRAGYDVLRPWDHAPEMNHVFEAGSAAPLRPYEDVEELVARASEIFANLDPALGLYFATMADESLLDLETRAGKALGGYCSNLPLRRRPFIFMNGVGAHEDVQTLLHEAGHAFHVFEVADLPLVWQEAPPIEFAEVASMSMELLAAPYLEVAEGGFYSRTEAARARLGHLENLILFLPYMAVVDAFQHWVYTHPNEARDPANLDAQWGTLWARFEPALDWSGFEEARVSGWHRKLHIFDSPFYYVEYGIAQIGAIQVWRNSRQDPYGAVAAYRSALALGGTRELPALFAAAGAEFRFDQGMLRELVPLLEEEIATLDQLVATGV